MDFNSGLLPYGTTWRLHRKMYNASLNKETACQWKPLAISKARQLVGNFFDMPEDFAKHCKTYVLYRFVRLYRLTMCSFAAATIMAATYGYNVAPKDDPFVAKVEYFISLFSNALTPERSALLLAFPFCMFRRSLCCFVALIVGVISVPHSILDARRIIQATRCGMPCACRGNVNQPSRIRHGEHGSYPCHPPVWH